MQGLDPGLSSEVRAPLALPAPLSPVGGLYPFCYRNCCKECSCISIWYSFLPHTRGIFFSPLKDRTSSPPSHSTSFWVFYHLCPCGHRIICIESSCISKICSLLSHNLCMWAFCWLCMHNTSSAATSCCNKIQIRLNFKFSPWNVVSWSIILLLKLFVYNIPAFWINEKHHRPMPPVE